MVIKLDSMALYQALSRVLESKRREKFIAAENISEAEIKALDTLRDALGESIGPCEVHMRDPRT